MWDDSNPGYLSVYSLCKQAVVVLSVGAYSYRKAQPGSKHYVAELDDEL